MACVQSDHCTRSRVRTHYHSPPPPPPPLQLISRRAHSRTRPSPNLLPQGTGVFGSSVLADCTPGTASWADAGCAPGANLSLDLGTWDAPEVSGACATAIAHETAEQRSGDVLVCHEPMRTQQRVLCPPTPPFRSSSDFPHSVVLTRPSPLCAFLPFAVHVLLLFLLLLLCVCVCVCVLYFFLRCFHRRGHGCGGRIGPSRREPQRERRRGCLPGRHSGPDPDLHTGRSVAGGFVGRRLGQRGPLRWPVRADTAFSSHFNIHFRNTHTHTFLHTHCTPAGGRVSF